MARTRNNVVYVVFILLSFVAISDGVICFSCHSSSNSDCGDEFRIMTNDVDSRFECPLGSCYKSRGKRTDGEVRRTEVSRGCRQYREDGCFTENAEGIEKYTCVCNTNFCNASSVFYLSSYCLFLSVFFFLLFR